jgi:hypothetical protein
VHSWKRKDMERRESNDFSVSWHNPNNDFCNDEPAVRTDGFLHPKKSQRNLFLG